MNARIYCIALAEAKDDRPVDMALNTTLPFVPLIGMHLAFNEGDYFKVDGVYWSSAKPDEIEVFTVEPDGDDQLPRAADLQAQGWVES